MEMCEREFLAPNMSDMETKNNHIIYIYFFYTKQAHLSTECNQLQINTFLVQSLSFVKAMYTLFFMY